MAVSFLDFRFPGLKGVRCAFQTRARGPVTVQGQEQGQEREQEQGHEQKPGAYDYGNISFATADDRAVVLQNRRDLREALGLRAMAELSQVHGDALVFEPADVPADGISSYEADGHATSRAGLGLMIKTADCQPILLAHVGGKHIMALHAGWRGNRIDFPGSAVRRFCEQYGLSPQDIMAVRGPSLGPSMAEFIHFDQEWGQDFDRWFDARDKCMDLWSLTRHQLLEAGLLPSRVYGLDLCTATMNHLFFSYRREKASGRQASVIWIE